MVNLQNLHEPLDIIFPRVQNSAFSVQRSAFLVMTLPETIFRAICILNQNNTTFSHWKTAHEVGRNLPCNMGFSYFKQIFGGIR